MKLNAINRNKNGDYYFLYEIEAPRSINPKSKRKENELIIVGVPQEKLQQYLDNCYKLSRQSKTKKELKSNLLSHQDSDQADRQEGKTIYARKIK